MPALVAFAISADGICKFTLRFNNCQYQKKALFQVFFWTYPHLIISAVLLYLSFAAHRSVRQ